MDTARVEEDRICLLGIGWILIPRFVERLQTGNRGEIHDKIREILEAETHVH